MKRRAVSAGLLRYPRARPSPPTTISPTTPGATGLPWSFRRYATRFGIARPIGGDDDDHDVVGRHSNEIQPTAASVGPYPLTNWRPGAAQRSTRSRVNVSPPA